MAKISFPIEVDITVMILLAAEGLVGQVVIDGEKDQEELGCISEAVLAISGGLTL